MTNNSVSAPFYPLEDVFYILLDPEMRQNADEQNLDNQGAKTASMLAVSLQPPGTPGRKEDLAALAYEDPTFTTAMLRDSFGFDERRLAAIRDKEPISIYSCLKCKEHLPEVARRTHLCRGRTLRYLCTLEVGARVELKRVCELLCESCTQGVYHCLDEQSRAERLALRARQSELRVMARERYEEYLKTPEWKVKRSRARIMAGNRCQVCGTTEKPLDVHHNTYERLGDELLVDLVVLCHKCHCRHHRILPKAA